MLPGSWTAHLVNCNTASITDEDFAWAELRAECVATGRHAAEYPKVQTENDDPPADITLRARKITLLPSTALSRRPARLFVIRRRKA